MFGLSNGGSSTSTSQGTSNGIGEGDTEPLLWKALQPISPRF